jgi:hypothetical protein
MYFEKKCKAEFAAEVVGSFASLLSEKPVFTGTPKANTGSGGVLPPKIGDIYPFGGYDWRVLAVESSRVLLLSEKVLEKRPYHNTYEAVTWEKCSLRQYLNGDFFSRFPDGEKNRAAERAIANNGNPWYSAHGGGETRDRVFVLGIEEAVHYLGDKNMKRPKMGADEKRFWDAEPWMNPVPDYMKQAGYPNLSFMVDFRGNAKRSARDGGGAACMWWLRTPCIGNVNAAGVRHDGCISVFGYNADIASGGVRPAMWVGL